MRGIGVALQAIGVAGTALDVLRKRIGGRLWALALLTVAGIVLTAAGGKVAGAEAPGAPGAAVAAASAGAHAPVAPASSGVQAPQLPDEVRAWLEMDQVQRWGAMVREGKALFDEGSCTRCHGEGGSGGQWGPDLTDVDWVQSDGSLEGIREVIFWGVRRRDFADSSRRFEMNPAGGMSLEWDEVRALAAYVWSLQNSDFLPRR